MRVRWIQWPVTWVVNPASMFTGQACYMPARTFPHMRSRCRLTLLPDTNRRPVKTG